MWTDVRQLIRVRSRTPDALMLSPTQAYFLRENPAAPAECAHGAAVA
jgi:uncharacterized protein HemX